MSTDYVYQGTELDLFATAQHWKAYWGGLVSRYLGSHVLDVGAGAGSTIRQLHNRQHEKWVALEPDARLTEQIHHDQAAGIVPGNVEVRVGTISQLRSWEMFDTVLYINVLEHIADDRSELQKAAHRLAAGGNLVVLAPAYQSLFSAFDAAIGHFRRYDRKSLLNLTPSGLKPCCVMYLDCVGLLASIGNRLVLKASNPSSRQIQLWDNWMVPASRFIDRLVMYNIGKSILVVWSKTGRP
jgi:SAM-dependent methyltransferase